MRGFWKTYAAVALAAGLAGYIFLVEAKKPAGDDDKEKLFAIEKTKVKTFTLSRTGGDTIEVKKDGENWKLASLGGIVADGKTASTLPGLYSVGECSSVGLHGANRLGSNSLTELIVFGKVAGLEAAAFAKEAPAGNAARLAMLAEASARQAQAGLVRTDGKERIATLRREMAQSMEDGCGIYRTAGTMQATCDKLAELRQRHQRVQLDDHSRGWNTEWLLAIELGFQLDVAQAMVHSALERRESRGSHQRLDGFETRDDLHFLKHTLATYGGPDAPPRIGYSDVTITRSPPGTRAYGAAGEKADAERKKLAEAAK